MLKPWRMRLPKPWRVQRARTPAGLCSTRRRRSATRFRSRVIRLVAPSSDATLKHLASAVAPSVFAVEIRKSVSHPAHQAQRIREVVGPGLGRGRAGTGFQRASCAIGPSASTDLAMTAHREVALPSDMAAGSASTSCWTRTTSPASSREIGDERRQVQVAVGDVESEDAAGVELLQIQLQRFARQQVDGNGVGAERVDHEHVESVRRFFRRARSARRRARCACAPGCRTGR